MALLYYEQGYSLCFNWSVTYVETEVEVEGPGDPDGDYAIELENTIGRVKDIFDDVENLLVNRIVVSMKFPVFFLLAFT